MRHILSVLVENEFGVLARVAGLFSGRGFNIESLCVAETLDPKYSIMTIVTYGDEDIMEQIKKQLNKLVNIIRVQDFTDKDYVSREMILVRVKATEKTRAEVLRMVDIFRGKIIDVTPESYIIEITGDQKKLSAFIELLKPIGILEIVRTGPIAMLRGKKSKKGGEK